MARGWESKSVEEQMEAAKTAREPESKQTLAPADQERLRKKVNLELVLTKIRNDLKSSTDPRHRQMLERALEDVGKSLAELG